MASQDNYAEISRETNKSKTADFNNIQYKKHRKTGIVEQPKILLSENRCFSSESLGKPNQELEDDDVISTLHNEESYNEEIIPTELPSCFKTNKILKSNDSIKVNSNQVNIDRLNFNLTKKTAAETEHTASKTLQKKDSTSTTVLIPQEDNIQSQSRSKFFSICTIKSLFKKSQNFSKTNKLSRDINNDNVLVPKFIFRYHAETDIDNVLPKSENVGYLKQYCTTLAISLNTFIFGIVLGLSFPIPQVKSCIPYFNNTFFQDRNLYKSIEFSFPNATLYGCLLGCFLWWHMINRAGRKVASLSCSFLYLICFLIFLYSSKFKLIYIAFLLLGFNSLSCLVNSYFYIPECIEDRMKNVSTVLYISLLFLGVYAFNVIVFCFGFKTLLYFSICTAGVAFICVLFIPESPVLYILFNNLQSARKSIMWFKHRENKILVSYEITLLLSKFIEKDKKFNLSCFLNKSNINALLLSFVMMVACSINSYIQFAMSSFITELFSKHFNVITTLTILLIVPLVLIALSIPILEKLKRKTILFISYGLVITSLIFLSITFNFITFEDSVDQMFLYWFVLISFIVFSINAIISSFVVPHIIFYEIFSSENCKVCMSLLYFFQFLLILTLIKLFPFIETSIRIGPSLIMCVTLYLVLITILDKYLPDTKDDAFSQVMKKFKRLKNKSFNKNKKISIFTIGDGNVE